MKIHLIFLSIIIFALGCEKPEEIKVTSMIAEYTGTAENVDPESPMYLVEVPEIKNKRSTTFVMTYIEFPGNAGYWIQLTDGWANEDGIILSCFVNWGTGEVYFWGMVDGDRYLIQVFEHD